MKRKKRLALPFLTAALKSNKLLNVNTACQKSVKSTCKRGLNYKTTFSFKLQIGSGNVYGGRQKSSHQIKKIYVASCNFSISFKSLNFFSSIKAFLSWRFFGEDRFPVNMPIRRSINTKAQATLRSRGSDTLWLLIAQ